jgi:hypothetical protein
LTDGWQFALNSDRFDYAHALNDPAGGVSKVIVKQQQPTE